MNTQLSPNAAIVVLNRNGADDTLACLDSLAALAYPNCNVNVVDNDLTDDSLAHTVKFKPLAAQMRLRMCLKSYCDKHLELSICT